MMNKTNANEIAFRILFPFIAGLILYLAMLTVFDSLDQLAGNFFSREAAFLVLLSYMNHELAVYLFRREIRNVIFHSLILLSATVLLNSAFIVVYFLVFIGNLYLRTELITINILFLLMNFMVHLYYLGRSNLTRLKDIAIQKEVDLERQLELELENFKHDMNPGLFLYCMETLVNLVHLDVQESEKYINILSKHYRYMLDNRHEDITDLAREIEAAGELVYLLGYNVKKSMTLETDIENGSRLQIVPGSLLFIVNWVFRKMIVSPMRPVHIRVGLDTEQNVVVTHAVRPRILDNPAGIDGIEKLNRSFRHLTGSQIESREDGQEMKWRIPRIPEIKEN